MTLRKSYVKKPVLVEAVLWDGSDASLFAIRELSNNKCRMHQGELYIATLEGNMRASVGSYIIKGVQGEPYPCKPDIFHATYTEILAPEIEEGLRYDD